MKIIKNICNAINCIKSEFNLTMVLPLPRGPIKRIELLSPISAVLRTTSFNVLIMRRWNITAISERWKIDSNNQDKVCTYKNISRTCLRSVSSPNTSPGSICPAKRWRINSWALEITAEETVSVISLRHITQSTNNSLQKSCSNGTVALIYILY